MQRSPRPVLLLTLWALAGCPTEVTLGDVQTEVFSQSCAFSSCHGAGQEGELGLTDASTSAAELVGVDSFELPGTLRVIAGDAEGSLLFQLLQGEVNPVRQMPVNGQVTQKQLDMVRTWIDDGALTE